MSDLTLYSFLRSSASYRVRIALALKGLEANTVEIDLRANEQRSPDYLAVGASGLVPTLVHDGSPLTQSLAIIEWLDAIVPEPRLIPAEPMRAARVREVALVIACDIHPLNNLRVLRYLTDELRLDQPTRDRWYAHWIREGFLAVERLLAREHHDGRFSCGDQVTLADVCIVPQMFNAWRFKVDVDEFAKVNRIVEECLKTLGVLGDRSAPRLSKRAETS